MALHEVLSGRSVDVVAEVSANHLGSLTKALDLLAAIADSGCRFVKFQHYTPESLTVNSEHPDFKLKSGSLWDGRSLYDLYSEGAMPWEWTDSLAERCRDLGLEWFSTPFDFKAAKFLSGFGVPAFKVASFELVDLPFISELASLETPLVISTGMATESEIDDAVSAARRGGCNEIMLLRCNSGYPAEPDEMNLVSIVEMRKRWGLSVGLSDHTLSNTSAVVAVALGATLIEKHVTGDRSEGGPDAAFSIEPAELSVLLNDVREAKASLGSVSFNPTERELASLPFRRSLRACREILKGEAITAENVRSMRPAGGLPPSEISLLMGRRVSARLQIGDPITWEVVR